MIEKRTVLDLITSDISGHVLFRFSLYLIEDGVVLQHQYHRSSVGPDTPLELQIRAVEEDLLSRGKNPISAEDKAKLDEMVKKSREIFPQKGKAK